MFVLHFKINFVFAGVSAFPTFHFYIAGRKVDELRGADPGELSRKVASLKPKAPAVPKPALSPLEALKEEAKRLFGLGKFAAAAEVLPVGPIEIEQRDRTIVETTISMVGPHLARSRTHLNPLSSK